MADQGVEPEQWISNRKHTFVSDWLWPIGILVVLVACVLLLRRRSS